MQAVVLLFPVSWNRALQYAVITDAVRELVDLRPGAIIQRLRLQRPIYAATAAYGHFGRTDIDAPWEATDLADALKNYVKEHTK